MNPSVRALLCAVVGLFAGTSLGSLFVPDPTGPPGPVLAVGVGVLVGGGLYRTDWFHENGRRAD